MYGEVETQFLLFGLLLHIQPLNSTEQHARADLEFSSDFEEFETFSKYFQEPFTTFESI